MSTAAARRVASRSSRRAARMARNTWRCVQPRAIGTVHRHHDGAMLLGRHLHLEGGVTRRELARRRREENVRDARDAVERGVVEAHGIVAARAGGHAAARVPLEAAHFEQVGEVRIEVEVDLQPQRFLTEVAQPQGLVAATIPEELGAREMHRVLGQLEHLTARDVRVGEVDVEHRVVGAHGRAQQQRAAFLDGELEAREMPRVLVVKAQGIAATTGEIAVVVEQRKGIAMFQCARRLVDQ